MWRFNNRLLQDEEFREEEAGKADKVRIRKCIYGHNQERHIWSESGKADMVYIGQGKYTGVEDGGLRMKLMLGRLRASSIRI